MIAPKDQEKIIFTCPYRTYSFKCMSFRQCDAPSILQRCMMVIFHDMFENFVKIFIDDFSLFAEIFYRCFQNLDGVMVIYKKTSLVLN